MDIMRKGFSLTELIIVIIIIAVLVTLAIPAFTRPREVALDKEAKANLKLIQAAEKIYHMEFNPYYYPSSGSQNNVSLINQYLKLYLPVGTNRSWNYTVSSTGTTTAVRSGRTWTLPITSEDPTCSGSCVSP